MLFILVLFSRKVIIKVFCSIIYVLYYFFNNAFFILIYKNEYDGSASKFWLDEIQCTHYICKNKMFLCPFITFEINQVAKNICPLFWYVNWKDFSIFWFDSTPYPNVFWSKFNIISYFLYTRDIQILFFLDESFWWWYSEGSLRHTSYYV
jgi:hypothetical protein